MNQQLTISFEPGLARRHANLRECFAACVYRAGLEKVAGACDVAKSNLSQMLSGARNLDTEIIERYMAEFDDVTPAAFLAAKWLPDAKQQQEQALAQIPGLVSQLNQLMEAAGVKG